MYTLIFMITAFAGMTAAAIDELPLIENSREFRRFEGLVLARDEKTVLRKLRGETTRTYVRQSEVPKVLADAIVAAEDRRFYSHGGVDPKGIARALVADLRAGSVEQGGSTITQQMVKNSYVGPDRTLARKTREGLLAVVVDARWSKQRILAAYMNTAYFGAGAYGVHDASRLYFGVKPKRLTLDQAAMLAALLPAPNEYNPVVAPGVALEKRNTVLATMVELDLISDRKQRAAAAMPVPSAESILSRRLPDELAPHFVDDVVGRLIERYGLVRTLGDGLRVTTTLDAPMQRAAVIAAREIDDTGLSVAIVAIDPRTGEVRALASAGPASKLTFDVASQGKRQPGSAFKPFALAAAYEAGYTPKTPVLSAPFRRNFDGTRYKVTNDSGTYAGRIPLEEALWQSDNTVFARVADNVGIREVVRIARDAGVRSPIDEVPATVLGGLRFGVSPEEMAGAYTAFAAHGIRRVDESGRAPRIVRVTNRGGDELESPLRAQQRKVPRLVADMVTDTMQGVISQGTGQRADIGRSAAGKTGTTDRNVDAWFIGYTPDLVTAVWVGHPEGSIPMRTEFEGGPVSGGTFPAQVWASFMTEALKGTPKHRFRLREPRYVEVVVDRDTRLRADSWCRRSEKQRFIAGTEPTEFSRDCPNRQRNAPDVVGMTESESTELLKSEGFKYEVREIIGDESQTGNVVNQEPEAGEQIDRNASVRLFVGARTRFDD